MRVIALQRKHGLQVRIMQLREVRADCVHDILEYQLFSEYHISAYVSERYRQGAYLVGFRIDVQTIREVFT